MKNQACEACKAKEKQLRIAKADAEFQIKKMTQDLAQEKVLLEMNYQKDLKKAIERFQKEKQQREEENKKWIAKYDTMVSTFQAKLQSLSSQHKLFQEKLKSDFSNDRQRLQTQCKQYHEHFVLTLKKEHEDMIDNLKEAQSKEILTLQTHQQEELRKLKKSHDQKILQLKSQYEDKVKQLKKEMDEVVESRDTLKREANQTKEALYQQLYQRKEEISGLKYKIDHLNLTIKNYQEQIRFKNHEIQILKEQHEEKLVQFKLQFEAEKTKLIQDYNFQIEDILVKKLRDCDLFEQNVKEIEQKRESELKMYEYSLKEVKELVEVRPSRTEDVEQITLLKDLLNRKEKEIQKVMEEVKSYKLEINYKDSTINRIFSANQNPLNIERIVSKKKQSLKSTKASLSLLKDPSKYNSIGTFHSISTTANDFKKEKLHIHTKSSKIV